MNELLKSRFSELKEEDKRLLWQNLSELSSGRGGSSSAIRQLSKQAAEWLIDYETSLLEKR